METFRLKSTTRKNVQIILTNKKIIIMYGNHCNQHLTHNRDILFLRTVDLVNSKFMKIVLYSYYEAFLNLENYIKIRYNILDYIHPLNLHAINELHQ